MNNDPHPLADYVRILARGKKASRHFTLAEAEYTMSEMLSGRYQPEQLGAIFMLLRVMEETPEEIAGFATAINQYWPAAIKADLVWPSYAGKRRQPFWCFLSAVLLSEMGYRIVFHGTASHTTGRLYVHQVFDEVEIHSDKAPIYLACQDIHPGLQEWLLLKRILGVRSPINTVLKTISPKGTPSVQGIFHPSYRALHQEAAKINKENAFIIKGEGGEFEVNPERKCIVDYHLNGQSGSFDIPHERSHFDDKCEGTSTQHLLDVWQGQNLNEYAKRAIIDTAALALCAIRQQVDFSQCLSECEAVWQSRNRELISHR